MTSVAATNLGLAERAEPRTVAAWAARATPVIGLVAVTVLAVLLRCSRTNTPFVSSDHTQLAYFCAHNWGWHWCFTTNYGPLQPLLTKAFAVAATALGFSMTESMWRLPMGLVGSTLPIFSYLLARRLSGSVLAAWTAALWAAFLPALVTDARYLWAYETLGVTTSAATLLAALWYLDRPTPRRAWLPGVCLAAYLWSHLLVHAVPCVLALLMGAGVLRRRVRRPLRAALHEFPQHAGRTGFFLPPLAAIAIMAVAHWRWGGGPLDRLTYKMTAVETSWRGLADVGALAWRWLGLFGWVFGGVFAVTFSLAAHAAIRFRAAWAPIWWWTPLFVAPLFLPLLVTVLPAGRHEHYFVQPSYAVALLTAVVATPWLLRRVGRVAATACVLFGTGWLAFSSIDITFMRGRYAPWTGVYAMWGAVDDNAGFKSAGWYIRTHVEPGHVVFATHDSRGLEWLPAAYYCGRACLAYCDLDSAESVALFNAFRDRIDVLVHDRRLGAAFDAGPDFARVASVRDGDRALIDVYARRGLELPRMSLDVRTCDGRFDEECAPRVLGRAITIPAGMPSYREIGETITRIRLQSGSRSS